MQAFNNPLVAVVVLNYNGLHYLQKFLPLVLESSYANKKIYVADNASTDDSMAMLQRDFPQVELILLDKNHGYAGGYNLALAQITADYYVLLNNDVEVTPNWINPIVELMESDPAIAACQPKILQYNNPTYFEYAGACGGWLDALGFAFSRGRVFDVCEADTSQYNQPQNIFWASGAAMFVRAAAYNQLGGLDGWFFAHMEEIDLCWRMQLAGYRVMCQPQAVVYHVGGGTLPKGNTRKVFLNFRNNLVMMAKNLPWYQKIYKLPLRVMLDVVFALKNLLAGQPAPCKAVFKAHVAVLGWMLSPKGKSSAQAVYKAGRLPLNKLQGVYKGSIVWQHFVKGKTTFLQIVDNKFS